MNSKQRSEKTESNRQSPIGKLKSKIFGLIMALFSVAFFISFTALFSTYRSFSFVKTQEFDQVESWSKIAKPIVSTSRLLTRDRVVELVAWDQGLWLLNKSEVLLKAALVFSDLEPATLEQKKELHDEVGLALKELKILGESLRQSKFVTFGNFSQNSFYWLDFIQDVWISEKPWLVLFQNTEEVRATGGFIGSYAELWFSPEKFGEIEIRDIYDPDGLIFTKLESPPGQGEYLSAGKGLRLPDANWSADFPTSAEKIMWFFSQVENDPRSYQGVIAINLSLAEDLVGVFGELEIAGLEEKLTKNNFSKLARESRVEFFAGSKQKTQFLNKVMTALRSEMNQLTLTEVKELATVLMTSIQKKDLQLYSPELKLQESIRLLGAAGEIRLPEKNKNIFYLVPIESNVGINKANSLITRELCTINKFEQIELNYIFHNFNQIKDRPTTEELANADYDLSPHLGYINYQRFLISPIDKIEKIIWQNQEIKDWSSRLITTHGGEVFQEIGFLIKLPEESDGYLQVIITPGQLLDQDGEIIIEFQSGVEYQACANTR